MKKILSAIACLVLLTPARSQVIIDTVSLGAGYGNQVWYSLANDNQASVPKTNWDISFDVSGQGSNIHINSAIGTNLWKYPGSDTSGWSTLDTTGISNWPKRWNSDTSWAMGAMGRYATANPYDVDWGIYSNITHVVTGDSLYIIKLANNQYKKLWIRSLNGGVYYFRYSDLNGTNLQNASLTKSSFSGQNFGYYSLQTNTAVVREPAAANWDLLFTQYTAFIPSPYTVSGILHNKGVKVAEVKPIAGAAAYTNWSGHTYKTAINEIGYDWKIFTTSWSIEDSLVYFVQSKTGDIWKIIPIGFGGSGNGNFIFSKEKLSAVGMADLNGASTGMMAVYPNPSGSGEIFVVVASDAASDVTGFKIYDVTGKVIKTFPADGIFHNRLNAFRLNIEDLDKGIYILNLQIGSSSASQKLIVEK